MLILACLPGTIVGTFLVELIGRKWTYALVALSNSTSWLIIATSSGVSQLILGRSLLGFALGMSYPACYCFIGEVVMVKYRSMLLNIINIGGTFGMLFSDLMGTFYSWRVAAYVITALGLTYFCILLYLKDTYVWYLNHNRIEEAQHAYFWYVRESPANAQDYNDRVNQVKISQGISFRMVARECKKREFIIPLFIMFWFSSTVVFTGGSGIALYSVTIMDRVVNMDEYITTLIIDVIRILAALVTILVLKYFPIRWIINTSSVLCATFLLVFSGSLYWESSWIGFQWIALVAIVSFNFFYSLGYININNISLGELFTGITKSVGTTISVMHLYCMNFIIAQLIPKMFANLGNVWTFLVFAICNIIGGVGLFLFMPETRNFTNEQIRENFRSFGKNKINKM